MIRLDNLSAPPRRNQDDEDEDLGEETLLEPPPAPPAPVLRWRAGVDQTVPCRLVVVTTRKTAALFPLLFPTAGAETLAVASFVVPSLGDNDAKDPLPADKAAECRAYRHQGVVYVNAAVDIPLESLHAWTSLLLETFQPTEQLLLLDLLNNEEDNARWLQGGIEFSGNEVDAPFVLRRLVTSATDGGEKNLKAFSHIPLLEPGIPLTGLAAAVLTKCQMLQRPAVGVLMGIRPSLASMQEFERALAPLVASVRDLTGGQGKGEEEKEKMQRAIDRLRKENGARYHNTALYS